MEPDQGRECEQSKSTEVRQNGGKSGEEGVAGSIPEKTSLNRLRSP